MSDVFVDFSTPPFHHPAFFIHTTTAAAAQCKRRAPRPLVTYYDDQQRQRRPFQSSLAHQMLLDCGDEVQVPELLLWVPSLHFQQTAAHVRARAVLCVCYGCVRAAAKVGAKICMISCIDVLKHHPPSPTPHSISLTLYLVKYKR